ncbi:MAG: hypothetical protein H0W40_19865 [Methylibium sp.]|nr:hypothetical protein [Methylibium sp.]
MPPSSIGNIEQRLSKSSLKIVQLARALRVRPEWLATGMLPMEAYNAEVAEVTLKLARRIESLSPPQLSAVMAMVDAFTSATIELEQEPARRKTAA